MIKRRPMRSWLRFPRVSARGLSIYGHGGIWRDVLGHARKLTMTAVALEVALLWLLGIMAGSFALLQSHLQGFPLPPVSLTLSQLIQTLLMPASPDQGTELGRVGVGAIALLAGGCLLTGTSRLAYLVSRVYRSSLPRRPRWVTLVCHGFLTGVIWVLVNLVLHFVGANDLVAATVADLRLQTAEGSTVSPSWQATLWHGVRWPVAAGLVGLGLACFYRLSPQRWPRGAPLMPGIILAIGLGAISIGLSLWTMRWITSPPIAYGPLLHLTIALGLVFWLILLVPLGAQFNVSLVNQGVVSVAAVGVPPIAAPPPSFETFKISRGPGDKFPRE
jgi:uncharacterized BrkB/YihY/UPF0761 family membrane protein